MYSVAVVGAAGLVGGEIVEVLEKRGFPLGRLKLLGSLKSAGARTDRGPVELLDAGAFADVDLAFFAAGPSVAGEHVPAALAAGARVVDLSSRYRLDPAVPLVVPEVNASLLRMGEAHDFVASPSASAIGLSVALAPLAAAVGLRRVIVATYQGAGSGGRRMLRRLSRDTIALLNTRGEPGTGGLGFDCIPRVGPVLPGGATAHELHLAEELRRVLALPDLPVSVTAVRVPAFFGQGMDVHLETERGVSAEEATRLLRDAPGLLVAEDDAALPPTLAGVAGSEATHVGRIREDAAFEHGLALWVALDSVQKGAALNAVEIAEILVQDRD